MTPKATEQLRGEEAWLAARTAIAKKNEAMHEQARKNRASRDAQAKARRTAEDRADCATAQRDLRRLG